MAISDNLYWYAAMLNPSKYDPTGVHDGDTVNAIVDLGAFVYVHKPLRLFGINAPELSTDAGKASRAWANNWFKTNCPNGQFIMKSNGTDPADKYGRLLATIYAPNGACFNTDILAAGMAVVYNG